MTAPGRPRAKLLPFGGGPWGMLAGQLTLSPVKADPFFGHCDLAAADLNERTRLPGAWRAGPGNRRAGDRQRRQCGRLHRQARPPRNQQAPEARRQHPPHRESHAQQRVPNTCISNMKTKMTWLLAGLLAGGNLMAADIEATLYPGQTTNTSASVTLPSLPPVRRRVVLVRRHWEHGWRTRYGESRTPLAS